MEYACPLPIHYYIPHISLPPPFFSLPPPPPAFFFYTPPALFFTLPPPSVFLFYTNVIRAPLCIGPYAQANALSCVSRVPDHGAIIYVAGQIPLDPAIMMVNPHFEIHPPLPHPQPLLNPQPPTPPNPPLHPEVSLLDALLLQLTLSLRHCARVLQPLGGPPITFP